jgi:glycolate oxidase FAD binding subunit
MPGMQPRWSSLRTELEAAYAEGRPVSLKGSGSRQVLPGLGQALRLGGDSGVLCYTPEELVVTVLAQTPLAVVAAALAERGQMLLGEPPEPGPDSTCAGAYAVGWAGPGRPWLGALSDGLLGVRLLTAPGGRLIEGRFGGRVIKNVAGFDVSRLQVGARGTLGVLLELDLRVMPRAELEIALRLPCSQAEGVALLDELQRRALPMTGCAVDAAGLQLRLAGAAAVVAGHDCELCAEGWVEAEPDYWQQLRDFRHPLFQTGLPVWRVTVPRGTPPLGLTGAVLIDWGGALQWWATDAPTAMVVAGARAAGGQAERWGGNPFADLPPDVLSVHQRIKQALDPADIFNRGLLPPPVAVSVAVGA